MASHPILPARIRRPVLRFLVFLGGGLATVWLTACLPPGAQTGAISVATGKAHACALLTNGTVVCWGANASGQIGSGNVAPTTSPATVVGLAGVVAVTAGDQHSCALDGAGTVWCWGEGGDGQLGTGTTDDATTPVAVLSGATSVGAGSFHTCASLTTGDVRCWGRNGHGQLGDGSTTASPAPVTVSGAVGIASVSAGTEHSCALAGDGSVSCWGRNASGQIGDGTTTPRLTATAVVDLDDVTQIDAGGAVTCARRSDATAWCWGSGFRGQLGAGNVANASTPQAVALPPAVTWIDTGSSHTCAVVSGGQAWCWGSHYRAQLGHGPSGSTLFDDKYATTPVRVVNPDPDEPITLASDFSVVPDPGMMFDDASTIAAGGEFTCATKSNKTIQCWGRGMEGQLGDAWIGRCSVPGSQIDCYIPVHVGVNAPVTGVATPTDASSTANHTCVVQSDRSVVCWGQHSSGRLGVGHAAAIPRAASSRVPDAVSVAAGEQHTCWALLDGTVRCAGNAGSATSMSALGYEATETAERMPLTVTGGPKGAPPAITTAVQVVAGHNFTCARLLDGTVECWGSNSLLQLGTWAVPVASVAPQQACLSSNGETCLVPLSGVVELAAGRDHVCALRDDGSVWCWGSSNAGQAGPPSSSPQPIAGVVGATTIGAGAEHSCAALATGGVKCWGRNSSGQLGGLFPASGTGAVTVAGITGVVDQLDGGGMHTCAVTQGDLWCWGENHRGQLGLGTTAGTVTANDCPVSSLPGSQGSCVPDPTPVPFVDDAAAVVAGEAHTCVISTTGTVRCWGANNTNQSGSDSDSDVLLSPVAPVTPPGG